MAREGKIPAVKIELGKNNKVIIRLPYNQKLIRKVKTIFGRRWNPKGKYWEVPYNGGLISKLPSLFGGSFAINPSLIYTHISRTNLAKMENPLDRLIKGGRSMISSRGMYMRNIADITPKIGYIRNADRTS